MLLLGFSIQSWLEKAGEAMRSLAVTLDGPGMLLVALADSSFLTIPEGNDILIVILSTGSTWDRMAYYVAMTILGSVAGCLLLYTFGRTGGSPYLRRKFSETSVERAEKLFSRYGILTVAVPSILPPPCPFKIFVFSAGVFRLSLPGFIIAVVIGRTIRYFMWGILAVLYGNSVKLYMQQNLPIIGMGLFGAFLLVIAVGTTIVVYRGRRERLRSRI